MGRPEPEKFVRLRAEIEAELRERADKAAARLEESGVRCALIDLRYMVKMAARVEGNAESRNPLIRKHLSRRYSDGELVSGVEAWLEKVEEICAEFGEDPAGLARKAVDRLLGELRNSKEPDAAWELEVLERLASAARRKGVL